MVLESTAPLQITLMQQTSNHVSWKLRWQITEQLHAQQLTATIPVTKELYREGVLLLDSFDKVLLSLGVLDRQGHHFRGGDGKFFVHRKSDGHLVAEFYLGKDNLYHVERNSNE